MEFKIVYQFIYPEHEQQIVGASNGVLLMLASSLGTKLLIKQGQVKIPAASEKDALVAEVMATLEVLLKAGIKLTSRDIASLVASVASGRREEVEELYLHKEVILVTKEGRPIFPRTLNQKHYLKALKTAPITLAAGPAGTGKTYLAVVFALAELKAGRAKKLILTRPVVEAGERLGFLPGDIKEKIDPYLIPLYDTLTECVGEVVLNKLLASGKIEIAPLAYMRGRTLDDAVIILDEAQNTTKVQMKMFLTRLGFNSKMIVTGDLSQIDLPSARFSGFKDVVRLLTGLDGVAIVEFAPYDVMRHPLVNAIIKRYEVDRES